MNISKKCCKDCISRQIYATFLYLEDNWGHICIRFGEDETSLKLLNGIICAND